MNEDVVPIQIPSVGMELRMETITLVIRDGDGNDLFEGVIPIESLTYSDGTKTARAIMKSSDLTRYTARILSSESREDGRFTTKPVTYPTKIHPDEDCSTEDCPTCGESIQIHRYMR